MEKEREREMENMTRAIPFLIVSRQGTNCHLYTVVTLMYYYAIWSGLSSHISLYHIH